MSKYQNLLEAKNQTIKVLMMALSVPTLLAVILGVGWMSAPSRITLHYPPDLSRGQKQGIHEIPKANIYAFTFYIFQQLNRWAENGEDDYISKVHILKHYLTPACFQDRMDDYDMKKARNELSGRERAVWEIPGRGFSNQRVVATSGNSWWVSLDLHVTETYRGEKVKDRLINYPLRVVRYDIDPELNPWGLAIDCFADKPRTIVIEIKDRE